MQLTHAFVSQLACLEGIDFADRHPELEGVDYNEAIRLLLQSGNRQEAAWLVSQKTTPLYVRSNGSNITVNAFQVYNPLTGQHTRFETEEQAKEEALRIANAIMETYKPSIVKEISNEKGDVAWEPLPITESLIVSFT